MKEIKGNLIEMATDFDVIIHDCNCFSKMDEGFASEIKAAFPEAFEADQKTEYGVDEKLGSYSFAEVSREGSSLIVVNAYTHFHWRGQGAKSNYSAIGQVFKSIAQNFSGKRIAYPKIGKGISGGIWEVISVTIKKELSGQDHTLVDTDL